MFDIKTWLKSGFSKLLLVTGLLLLVSTFGFYFLELKTQGSSSIFEALYWTLVTLTTVGYGDLVPKSPLGRVLALVVMLSGIGLVSALSGNLASFLVERNAQKRKGLLLVKLTRHVVIMGWNSYAFDLINTLRTKNNMASSSIVVVGELSQDKRDEIAYQLNLGDHLHFVFGNPTQKNVISRASIDAAQAVYILSQTGLPPNEADQQAIYSALTARSLAPKVPMYGEVTLADNREHLLRAGVNDIIVRGEVTSHILGLMGASSSMWPFFQTLLGLQCTGALNYHALTADEKKLTWQEFHQNTRSQTGKLPLALCREPKGLNLEDVLDEGSALDRYILELFASSGRKTQLGNQGSRVLVNPRDNQSLDTYDGILYLAPGQEDV